MDLYKYFYNLPGNEEQRVKMIIATDTAEYIFALLDIRWTISDILLIAPGKRECESPEKKNY